jgi:23S rRNA (uracil1939-C5)-methyltransferase
MNLVVKIEKMGYRGMGIARREGKVVLVPFAAPGDHAEVRVTRVHRDYDEAEIVTLIQPSSLRRNPPCLFFGACGGCQLQHLPISFQRTLKGEIFREMLEHQGGVDGNRVRNLLFSSNEFDYRSHCELHVDWREKPLVGFMAPRENNVVPINQCLVVHPLIRSILPEVSKILTVVNAHQVNEVAISCDFPDGKNVITFFSGKRLPDHVEKALGKLIQEIPRVKGLYLVARKEMKPIMPWKEAEASPGVLYSVPFKDEEDLILEACPGVFRQVNPEVNRIMISIILDWTKDLEVQHILELYAGMGNFTIPVSFVTQNVLAIESNALAVENAKTNALRHDRKNIQWRNGSVKDEIKSLGKKSFDLILLDPPRTGAKEVLKEIILLHPKNILYISCEPATLARDLQFLKKQGSYEVKMTQPLDMFPQTFHMESITVLQKTT